MSLPLVLVEGPSQPPVTAAEAKVLSYALAALPDATVNVLVASAASQLDGPYGLLLSCIITQTWRQPFNGRQAKYRLPALGNVEVKAVSPAATFMQRQDQMGDYIESSAEIAYADFTAGFGTPDKVPQNIKTAIVLIAADIYGKVSEQGGLRSFETYQAFVEQYSSPEVMSAATRHVVQSLLGRYRGIVFA